MKHKYRLTINNPKKSKKGYRLKYKNTKDIIARFGKGFMEIEVTVGAEYNLHDDNSYLMMLLKDCIKKLSVVHLIKYGENIVIKDTKIEKITSDGNQSIYKDLTIYCLFDGKLIKAVSDNLKSEDIIDRILSLQKSQYGPGTSGVFAYLYSKSTELQSVRFSYLWMALNGFYEHKYQMSKDKESLDKLIAEYGYGNRSLSRAEREMVCPKIWKYLLSVSAVDFDCNNEKNAVINKIKSIISTSVENYNTSIKGFVTFDLAYYLRCNQFHANKPIMLYAFEDDPEIRVLRIIADYLEEFLDKHIYETFV